MDLRNKIELRIKELEQNIVNLRKDSDQISVSDKHYFSDKNYISSRIELYSASIMELKQVLEWINN